MIPTTWKERRTRTRGQMEIREAKESVGVGGGGC